jgi:Cu2+-exporting ATPase
LASVAARPHPAPATAGQEAGSAGRSVAPPRSGVPAFGSAAAAGASLPTCAHCGQPAAAGRRFCCPGCEAAFETIQSLGLGRYYSQRLLDPTLRAPRPESGETRDLARFITDLPDGGHEITLAIDGLQCGACVWLIESVLGREPDVVTGRVNMTSRRLKLVWRGGQEEAPGDARRLIGRIEALGYRLIPFDAGALAAARDHAGRALLRALAVAGFAAGNVMLISIGIWAGEAAGWLDSMGPATRDLLHWVSALIALPAIAYAGMPFFVSAAAALRHGRTNMDVPISIGVALVTGMSLVETIGHGRHTYFDSAITLLFFLLIGRVLDHRARGQARATAEQLLTLRAADAAVVQPDGSTVRRAQQAIAPGDRVLVGLGERISVDGVVEQGASSLDASLVTGESLPVPATPGTAVFAGTLNLGAPLTVRATATGGTTLLAECVRLIEAAEAGRSRFVVLADRVARRYAPAVHLAALLTFLGWYFGVGATASQALLIASAVLIITCPCALALAVPAVQVIATSRLFAAGVLLKSATALERLAEVDTVVFDKTGTLTEPVLSLVRDGVDPEALRAAAALAANSRHPLARSLLAAAGPVPAAEGVTEHPGQGLSAGDTRLGSAAFCLGAKDGTEAREAAPELWLTRSGHAPTHFTFDERPRPDAAETVSRLHAMGLSVRLLSGDRAPAVARIATTLAIADWAAEQSPVDKVARVEALARQGRRVLMVGDGLNDSPSLAAAHVSASPSSAADVSQTVADVVFQGLKLAPIARVIATARRARTVMRQNLALSIGYNLLMVPLAVGGWVTPWLAAAAMSGSSLLVIANSFRLRRKGDA